MVKMNFRLSQSIRTIFIGRDIGGLKGLDFNNEMMVSTNLARGA